MEAQRYPKNFDGIMAASPAINAVKAIVAMQWPYIVIQNEDTAPSQCVFQAFIDTSVKLCDGLDGVKDLIISDGELLFRSLICGGEERHLLGRRSYDHRGRSICLPQDP